MFDQHWLVRMIHVEYPMTKNVSERESTFFFQITKIKFTCCIRRANFPFAEWSLGDVGDCLDGENCDSSK
jgi:hypothetical protein